MTLKEISTDAVPRALDLAERYRLLNEPEQAESICRDVIAAEPTNQLAIRTLLLSLSDQFATHINANIQQALAVAGGLIDDYERHYFSGVVMERWARGKLHQKQPVSMVVDWVYRAMDEFDKAETVRPAHDDAALLRWNTCARLLEKLPKTDSVVAGSDIFD